MSPRLKMDNKIDIHRVNIVSGSKLLESHLVGFVFGSDALNNVPRKLCKVALLTCAIVSVVVVTSSLANLVPGVVDVASKKQVIRINTIPNIALVQNELTVRYWTVVDDPRCSVGFDHFMAGRSSQYDTVSTLSSVLDAARPQPAWRKSVMRWSKFIDFFPESVHESVRPSLGFENLVSDSLIHLEQHTPHLI